MAKAEDLTGKVFGYLKVLERAEDHVAAGGQKKVRWLCECLLCGTQKVVPAQSLKRGSAVSCGCYQAWKGRQMRNKRTCIICNAVFDSPPSSNNVTCSLACRKEYARRRTIGKPRPEDVRKKMSASAQGRDMTDLQVLGTTAAMQSPKSGRFVTNINAIDWHLISPEGKHYFCHSLHLWLRENCAELFGVEPDSRGYRNICAGLNGAKRAMLGKKYRCCTYKGWQVLPTESDYLKLQKGDGQEARPH